MLYSAFGDPRLFVASPDHLTIQLPNKTIPFVLANTQNNNPYGAHFVGGLFLPSQKNGCNQTPSFKVKAPNFDKEIFAIVEMGGCELALKAENAKIAGATILMIVQDTDEQLPQEFSLSNDNEETYLPVILIPKIQGDILIRFLEQLPNESLKSNDVPILGIKFPDKSISNKVALDFWMTNLDLNISKILTSIAPNISQYPETFRFTPHFIIYYCIECRRTNYQSPIPIDCISSGLYCVISQDNSTVAGNEIVLENLRQKCAWKINPSLWWNYIEPYTKECLNKDNLEGCSLRLFGNYSTEIQACVSGSFIDPQEENRHSRSGPNTILDEEQKVGGSYDISITSSLLINHQEFKGNLNNPEEILKAICANMNKCEEYFPSLFPKPQSNVTSLDFWLTSADPKGYNILAELSKVFPQNMINFNFTPHYFNAGCPTCEQHGYNGADCISSGRYCANSFTGPLKGSEIVLENLRQLCAWSIDPSLWWNYILGFRRDCINQLGLEDCSHRLFGNRKNEIQFCVKASFVDLQQGIFSDNMILARENNLQSISVVREYPSLFVDHKPYKGNVRNYEEILHDLCLNLINTVPYCSKYASSLSDTPKASKQFEPISRWYLFLITLVVLGVFLLWSRNSKKQYYQILDTKQESRLY